MKTVPESFAFDCHLEIDANNFLLIRRAVLWLTRAMSAMRSSGTLYDMSLTMALQCQSVAFDPLSTVLAVSENLVPHVLQRYLLEPLFDLPSITIRPSLQNGHWGFLPSSDARSSSVEHPNSFSHSLSSIARRSKLTSASLSFAQYSLKHPRLSIKKHPSPFGRPTFGCLGKQFIA